MTDETVNKARTGIPGLDAVLNGGFVRNRMYLIEGLPGTGKTTLAMQFLLEGVRQGERVLYVTLSETAEELRASAASHGWSLEGVEIFELTPPESLLDGSQQQSLLYSADLELGETTRTVFTELERVKPDRAVLDSLAEIRLLAQDSLRFRRQILALKHYFSSHRATVLALDDMSSGQRDRDVHSLAHGVVRMEELSPLYGAERRRLRVVKYRGTKFRGGYHDFSIVTGGVEVFPRLVAAEHRREVTREVLSSGTAELDNLLGGGLVYGSSTLVLGPAGSGKTLIALSFARAAIARGELASLFLFEEDPGMLASRARGVGMRLDESARSGRLAIEQVDAAELSPGEFAQRVRNSVEQKGARLVVIDSLNGYQLAMPEDKCLILHMHELLSYLNRRGVLTLLTVAQHGIVGEDMKAPVDVTYLSDTVVMLRFFEAAGRVRRAISVVKRRAGPHEQSIRELQIMSEGIKLGAPLEEFQGVLQGIPRYTGASGRLLGGADD